MTRSFRRVRYVIGIIGFLTLSIVWAACGSTSSSGVGSSPTLPAQIPTTVEYMGETVAGDISVPTGQTATFTVLDADGNVMDPVVVTAVVSEPSFSIAKELLFDESLGGFTAEGNYLVYEAVA